MHSHLDIQVNGKSLVIPDNSSLSVEEKNPMFNDVTFFSYPMQIPVEGNREVLKNIAHRDSDMRAMDLEHADARIFADGLPLNHGQVITQDGSKIKDTFEFNIDAQQQSFSELIGNMNCQDVDISSKHIVIGEKIGKITVTGTVYAATRHDTFGDDDPRSYNKQELRQAINEIVESPQALGFSFPGRTQGFPTAEKDEYGNVKVTESFINVTQPYPFPYCNSRVAYAKPEKEENEEDNRVGWFENIFGNIDNGNGYYVLDANRQQSGICFYVLYFLDCMFEQLGVVFEKDELLEIEDFKRLCFFTTKCSYDEEETGRWLTDSAINDWLTSRNCGAKIDFLFYTGHTKNYGALKPDEWHELEEEYPVNNSINEQFALINYGRYQGIGGVKAYRELRSTVTYRTNICDMVANSYNFPNASVSSVISSLENSFGIRFLYDPEKRIVTARLLRNIYKREACRHFNGKVLGMTPLNEKITGVRMAYSSESDKTEQRNNVRYGIKDYDTNFDYIEYPQNRTITNLTYQQMVTQQGLISTTNRNVYVDKTTGDSYRVKINSEADDMKTLKPVLFRVGQFKGVEEGDCSERNADYVREYISEFLPLVQNIVNAQQYNVDGNTSPLLAPYLDVDMEPANTEKNIDVVCIDFGKIPETTFWPPSYYGFYDNLHLVMRETLTLAESYDPTQTESGNSPLQDIDWGLTIAVMRGGGNNAGVENFDDNYDGFGNDKWRYTVGTYAISSDTVTPKGVFFDYNGSDPGLGGIHFSLSIRAWVWPEWAEAPLVVNDPDIKDRGLYDMFMRPHAHFLLHRKKYSVPVQATIAQLLDIRNHWEDKYVLDGKVGWINAIKYNIKKATGVADAELEFYAL